MTAFAEPSRLLQRALRIEYLTIAWMIVEAAVALASGIAAHSIALVGFGLDSVVELFAAVVVVWQLWGSATEIGERRAVRLIGASFFVLAAYVTFESARTLVARSAPEVSAPGLAVSGAALLVMPLLAQAKRRIGRALDNRAILADAAETLFCAALSATTLAGLGVNALFGWWWADPAAGLAIAGFALREGLEAFRGEVKP